MSRIRSDSGCRRSMTSRQPAESSGTDNPDCEHPGIIVAQSSMQLPLDVTGANTLIKIFESTSDCHYCGLLV